MLRLLILILCAATLILDTPGQDESVLRRGGYFKPDAARLELNRIASKVPDLAASVSYTHLRAHET